MTALVWDAIEDRDYEQGVDWGTLYDENHTNGVAWNGLTSVEESHPDASMTAFYQDGIKYLDSVSPSDIVIKLSTISVPVEFAPCCGDTPLFNGFYLTGQRRQQFGLVYRTKLNTTDYKLHLIYNAMITPASKVWSTIRETPELVEHVWDITTQPMPSTDYRPTAHLVIDSRKVDRGDLDVLEEILFGSSAIGLIDGGPVAALRSPFDGGVPADNPSAILIDGGAPLHPQHAVPTLISPDEIREILRPS